MGNKQKSCKFCDMIATNDKNIIIYEDDEFVMFNDIKPCAKIHILAVPKEHIINCNHLLKCHLEKISNMKEKVIKYFQEHYTDIDLKEIKLGFHSPPFVMINHLHMHCIVPPFTGKISEHIMFGALFRSVDSQIEKLKQLK
jgi:diadenosine tetraphosphate (Ap4A) HIT family hydrolase